MNQLTIKLHCQCCGKVHDTPLTDDDIHRGAKALACNFCWECQDKMTDYYNEWTIEEAELPVIENPAQLKLFSK